MRALEQRDPGAGFSWLLADHGARRALHGALLRHPLEDEAGRPGDGGAVAPAPGGRAAAGRAAATAARRAETAAAPAEAGTGSRSPRSNRSPRPSPTSRSSRSGRRRKRRRRSSGRRPRRERSRTSSARRKRRSGARRRSPRSAASRRRTASACRTSSTASSPPRAEGAGDRTAGRRRSSGARVLAEPDPAKIRSNIVLPPDLAGNPQAEFDVALLPTGEVLSVKLARSSGNRALDDAWERAILKSSPLPRPSKPEIFVRDLRLKFRPSE